MLAILLLPSCNKEDRAFEGRYCDPRLYGMWEKADSLKQNPHRFHFKTNNKAWEGNGEPKEKEFYYLYYTENDTLVFKGQNTIFNRKPTLYYRYRIESNNNILYLKRIRVDSKANESKYYKIK